MAVAITITTTATSISTLKLEHARSYNDFRKETIMLTLKKSLAIVSLAAAAVASMGIATTASAAVLVQVAPGYVHVDDRGWHGDRYYDGHRYWERREWERHHPVHHYAPPPNRYY